MFVAARLLHRFFCVWAERNVQSPRRTIQPTSEDEGSRTVAIGNSEGNECAPRGTDPPSPAGETVIVYDNGNEYEPHAHVAAIKEGK